MADTLRNLLRDTKKLDSTELDYEVARLNDSDQEKIEKICDGITIQVDLMVSHIAVGIRSGAVCPDG